jgi:hypothetical protein
MRLFRKIRDRILLRLSRDYGSDLPITLRNNSGIGFQHIPSQSRRGSPEKSILGTIWIWAFHMYPSRVPGTVMSQDVSVVHMHIPGPGN